MQKSTLESGRSVSAELQRIEYSPSLRYPSQIPLHSYQTSSPSSPVNALYLSPSPSLLSPWSMSMSSFMLKPQVTVTVCVTGDQVYLIVSYLIIYLSIQSYLPFCFSSSNHDHESNLPFASSQPQIQPRKSNHTANAKPQSVTHYCAVLRLFLNHTSVSTSPSGSLITQFFF